MSKPTNLRTQSRLHSVALLAACSLLTIATTALAQQITGTPGSPSATTTLDGRYVPNPPAPFGGVINLDATHSTPYWPPTVVPPKGALQLWRFGDLPRQSVDFAQARLFS